MGGAVVGGAVVGVPIHDQIDTLPSVTFWMVPHDRLPSVIDHAVELMSVTPVRFVYVHPTGGAVVGTGVVGVGVTQADVVIV